MPAPANRNPDGDMMARALGLGAEGAREDGADDGGDGLVEMPIEDVPAFTPSGPGPVEASACPRSRRGAVIAKPPTTPTTAAPPGPAVPGRMAEAGSGAKPPSRPGRTRRL